MSSWILPRASQTAWGGWRPQCYGQGGAASRCGLGWQQTDLCNALSWIRSEIRPWHLLQVGAAAGLLIHSSGKLCSVFIPSLSLRPCSKHSAPPNLGSLSSVALVLPPQSQGSLHWPRSCFVSSPKQRGNLSNKEEFGEEKEHRTANEA